jgi:hypothetical protein
VLFRLSCYGIHEGKAGLSIGQFPESGHVPAELEGFVDDSFLQALFGKNRIIYQVRDDTIYVHLVVDTRRDLLGLLQRIVRRLL